MEDGGFQVEVMGIFAILLLFAEDEAQAANGRVKTVFMDVGASPCGIGIAAEVAEDDLGLGFEEVTFAANVQSLSVFHGQALFIFPVGSSIRVFAVGMEGGVVPADLGYNVCVIAMVSDPGGVEGAGEGVVLAAAAFKVRRCNAPFYEETVGALFIGHGVYADLEEVVLAVVAVAIKASVPVPHPEVVLIVAAVSIAQVPPAAGAGCRWTGGRGHRYCRCYR